MSDKSSALGKLFVIEGIDGSGKSTQYQRLLARLPGFTGAEFPNYGSVTGKVIRAYLDGAFGGSPDEVNAYAASSFYAADRCASFLTDGWGRALRSGGSVLLARYTTSNAIHQAAKLPPSERPAYWSWLEAYEYGLLALPKPDAVVYLRISADEALRRIEGRGAADIQETSGYLRRCAQCADDAAAFFGWERVEVGGGESVEQINDILYKIISDRI